MRGVLIVAACALCAPAVAEPVRVLEDGGSFAVVGTDTFSVRVESSGAITRIMVGETEWSWLIRLYTSPISFETGETIRAVQGEGARGLGPVPERIRPELRGEACSIVIEREAAREEILAGEPIYRLTQTVTVHPAGRIGLRYEFEWLRFVQMRGAQVIIALRAAPLDGCEWWADFTSHVLHGTISAEPDAKSLDEVKGALRTFTADCGAADLSLWIADSGRVTAQRWNPQDYAFFVYVPHTGYGTEVYPGVRSVVDLDLVLPIPEMRSISRRTEPR